MTTRKTRLTRSWKGWIPILSLVLLGGLACVSSAAAAEVPAEVRQALQRNVEALSPIRISWTQQLGSDLSVQEWLKKVNLEGFYVDEFSPAEVTHAWQDGMSYSHIWRTHTRLDLGIFVDKETGELRAKPGFDFSKLPHMVSFNEVACNRKNVFIGERSSGRNAVGDHTVARNRQDVFIEEGSNRGVATLVVDSIDNPKWFSRDNGLFEPAYFREAGFVLPRSIAMHQEGPKSLPLALVESGARVTKVQETTLDGRICLLLELEGKDLNTRFYLDPACGYAVRRREEVTRSGQLAVISTASDLVQFRDPDVWLPRRCDVVHYTWDTIPDVITEKPLAKRTFVVLKIDKHPLPAERFSLRYSMPGTTVVDSTLLQAKQMPRGVLHYVVPEDPDDLDAVIQAAADGKPFFPKGLQVSKTKSSVTLASLTEDQQRLVQSMAAATDNKRAAQLRVAVFDDERLGSDPNKALPNIFGSEPAAVWKVVSSADIQAGALDRFNVIIFLGGSGKQQAAALGDKGRRAVQEFVRAGGGYVGICAGGFLATCKPNSLSLVNAKASVSTDGGWVKMELTDVGKSILGKFPDLVAAQYGGGPIFSPAGEHDLPDYVPLAFYRTEVAMSKTQKRTLVDTPAIIAARFGKGRVLLFSVHPERRISGLESLVKRAILSVAAIK